MQSEVWDEITYPLQNFNGTAVDVYTHYNMWDEIHN